jgi:hypothetical protein
MTIHGGRGSHADDEPVAGGLEGCFMLAGEHVGGHVGDDDAAGGKPVPAGDKVSQAQVIGNVLVPAIRLGDEQVSTCGRVDAVAARRCSPGRSRVLRVVDRLPGGGDVDVGFS